MRIFQVIEATANSHIVNNLTWHRNLYEPLIDLGCDVIQFSAYEGRIAMQNQSKKQRAHFSDRLLSAFGAENAKNHIDLFFSYLMDGMIEPATISEIKKSGTITCNFSCNNIHQFENVDGISPYFDYNLHAEKEAEIKFRKIGANPLWWPMAANPKYYKGFNVSRDIKMSFSGANYGLRALYVKELLENGMDIHVWGPNWASKSMNEIKRLWFLINTVSMRSAGKRYKYSYCLAEEDLRYLLNVRYPKNIHGFISDHEYISLFSRSEISLGILDVYDQHDPARPIKKHIHLREFEAPMSGALYITGYIDSIDELYEVDKEILIYRNIEELIDKVRYYLNHPEVGEKVRIAGRKRALADHTYQKKIGRAHV